MDVQGLQQYQLFRRPGQAPHARGFSRGQFAMAMILVHVELAEANAFITKHHRHHRAIPWHRFSVGAMLPSPDGHGRLVGVAVVGRPLGGAHQDRWVEVTRLCSDGTPNVCSFLYGAAARAAFALGFTRIQTYILRDEPGTSLKGAGWLFDRMSHPSGWHKRGRPLAPHLRDRKQLWFSGERPVEATLGAKSGRAAPLHPWERVGMGRSTWYRKGKPKRPAVRMTQAIAAHAAGVSVRTIQRRALVARK
jgi:hypothetical protein